MEEECKQELGNKIMECFRSGDSIEIIRRNFGLSSVEYMEAVVSVNDENGKKFLQAVVDIYKENEGVEKRIRAVLRKNEQLQERGKIIEMYVKNVLSAPVYFA